MSRNELETMFSIDNLKKLVLNELEVSETNPLGVQIVQLVVENKKNGEINCID